MIFLWIVVLVFVVKNTQGYTDKDVVQCLQDNGLTSFKQLLDDSKMLPQLSGTGPFTILAPTNSAVTSIDPDLLQALIQEPVLLKQIVQYHIIPDYTVLPELSSLGSINTLEGQPVTFTGSGANLLINNSSRPIAGDKSDIICKNGIIHTIDKVILPPVFSTSNIAATLLIRDDLFRDMFMALLLNNLTAILEGSEFTLFAPTDLAFGRYSELNNINPYMPNAALIYHEVFKYHMVPGRRTSHQLRDGEKLYTLHGYPVDITINASGMKVDHANIVETDIAASNGVIHAIDHIIFPTDLLDQLTGGVGSSSGSG